jgi:hypothetical protein
MASLKDLCLLVRGTGLMNLCSANNTRLHNKPMAVVRLELLLTGIMLIELLVVFIFTAKYSK